MDTVQRGSSRVFGRILIGVSVAWFLAGVISALYPEFLGCVEPGWVAECIVLAPLWFLIDAAQMFHADGPVFFFHLFCLGCWVVPLLWVVGGLLEIVARCYGRQAPSPGRPWHLAVPPGLALLLFALVATNLPLRVSFWLHRDAFQALAVEACATATEKDGRDPQMFRHPAPARIGIYRITSVEVAPDRKSCFMEVQRVHANNSDVRLIQGDFVFRGTVRQGHVTRLDDDWQATRWGGSI